jgi:hypothetical protein
VIHQKVRLRIKTAVKIKQEIRIEIRIVLAPENSIPHHDTVTDALKTVTITAIDLRHASFTDREAGGISNVFILGVSEIKYRTM